MSARNFELEEYMYKTVMSKLYPDSLVCLDEEKQIFQKVKPYRELTNDEASTFVMFASSAMNYFEQLKREELCEKIEDSNITNTVNSLDVAELYA